MGEKLISVVKDAKEVLETDLELRKMVAEWGSKEAKMEGEGARYYDPVVIIFFLRYLKKQAKALNLTPSEALRRLFLENPHWGNEWNYFSTWLFYEITEIYEEEEEKDEEVGEEDLIEKTRRDFAKIREKMEFYKACHLTTFDFIVWAKHTSKDLTIGFLSIDGGRSEKVS